MADKRTVRVNTKRLIELRKSRGWSQERLAELTGTLSAKTVSRVEGGAPVFPVTIQAIASALSVKVEELTDRDRLADDDMQVFLDIQRGALNVLLDHANADGFILMSEDDVKEYMLWFIERLPAETVGKCREGMLEIYQDSTGEPADLTLNITSARLLRSWLEDHIGQLIELAELHITDYKPLSGEELKSHAEKVASGPERELIEYFQYSWALVEKAIEDLGGGIAWWKILPVILRKGQITSGQTNVIMSYGKCDSYCTKQSEADTY